MKVLIIPEDQELDRYIVKPVIEALFRDLGRPVQVDVLPEPRLRGADQALDRHVVAGIIDENPMIDLFLLMVDRDCNRQNAVERAAERVSEQEGHLLAVLAEQEVEVWMLALFPNQIDVPFSEVRQHCDPKEAFAEPFLTAMGAQGPGRGRKAAMRSISGKWRSLRDRCPELRGLQDQIEGWLADPPAT